MYAIAYRENGIYYERIGFMTLDAVDNYRRHKTYATSWMYYRVRPNGMWDRVSSYVLCHDDCHEEVMES